MKALYRMLLQLYSRNYRADFAEEMLLVFEQAAAERRTQTYFAYAQFLLAEYIGLLIGAAVEQFHGFRLGPALGGIAAAALLHAALYMVMLEVLLAMAGTVESVSTLAGDPRTAALTLAFLTIAAMLFLLPVFFLLNMRLLRRQR
jgi:hypothetical protein